MRIDLPLNIRMPHMDHLFKNAATVAVGCLRHRAQSGRVRLSYALVIAALVFVVVGVFMYVPSLRGAGASTAAQPGVATGAPREVDFGLVELNPGLPTPITSYKNGGNMVLFAGDELHFEVQGESPPPGIELRVGAGTQTLLGGKGKTLIAGPAGQPQPALMLARGGRVSLPGNAPPRIAVKVQVFGAARSR